MSEAAYFINYDSERQLMGFSMLMDSLGASRYGRWIWILRTERAYENIWKDLAPFCKLDGTLFMIQIFPNSLGYCLPHAFTHDPLKKLLMGLEPYIGNK
jgi:hypothetical protein